MRVRKTATDRRAEIVDTALSLAFEVGPERVTTGMIANRMGLTQPSIYKHFAGKEDIWLVVVDTLCAQISANVAKVVAGKSAPEEQVKQLVLDHLRLVQGTPALPEIMVMRDPDGAQGRLKFKMQTCFAKVRGELVSNIQAAVASGHFRADLNPQDAATLVVGIIQSLVLRLLLSRDPDILLADGERLLQLQLEGFTPQRNVT